MPGREAQFATRLLLQGRGAKGRVRGATERLALHRAHREGHSLEVGHHLVGRGVVEHDHVVARHPALTIEVLTGGDPHPAKRVESGDEAPGGHREVALDVPVLGGAELDPLPLPLHHDADRRTLHPAGGELGAHQAPQHRRHLVSEETIEDAPGFLGVDETTIHLTRRLHRGGDGLAGDLVEHHPLHRDLRFEHFGQVPGDRLALAVFVGGEVQLVGALEKLLEMVDLLLLVGRHDVERLEAVGGVHAETRPRLLLVAGGHGGSVARQVAHMPDRRLDHVSGSEESGNGASLGGRLDDDEFHRPRG